MCVWGGTFSQERIALRVKRIHTDHSLQELSSLRSKTVKIHARGDARSQALPTEETRASLRLAGCILQPRRSLNCIQRAPPCQQPRRQSAALQAKVPFIFFLLSSDVFHSGLISSNPGCRRDRAAEWGGGGVWVGEREEK